MPILQGAFRLTAALGLATLSFVPLTAGAAESLAREALADVGAIASSLAAELYGLKVLKRNLQNRADMNELLLIRRFEAELGQGATPQPVVTASAFSLPASM